jgi:hypothetical protein
MEGAFVYNRNLRKEKWQIPMSDCDLEYIGRGVFLSEVVNTNVTPLEITLSYLTRRGVRAEHVLQVEWPPVATAGE